MDVKYDERRSSQAFSTQVASSWRGPRLPDVAVLAMAGGLFGRCGSERLDELFISTREREEREEEGREGGREGGVEGEKEKRERKEKERREGRGGVIP